MAQRIVCSSTLFLPDAFGNTDFWQPVASPFNHKAKLTFFGWPGFGKTPDDPISPIVVASVLAKEGISANVIAAYHHGHVFFRVYKVDQAMQILINLNRFQ